jgi:alpha/beta superfamily hydrolase
VQFTTADGQALTGDLVVPGGPARGGLVVCHPHPQYGGNRFNPVVDAVLTAAVERGFVTLRFDFRAQFAEGIGERLDVVAALDNVEDEVGDAGLWLAGYSFGALVALATDDPRVRGIAAIAPPLTAVELGRPTVPTIVVAPAHDQFCPPGAAAAIVAEWPDTHFETVESADHFLAGHARDVADRVVTWISARAG